jgi:predicted nucleic acid-binding protein
MAAKTVRIVLDSWAVLAMLQGEAKGQKVVDAIASCLAVDGEILMTVVNLGEVWYTVARRLSESEADRSVADLRGLGIDIADATWELTRQAAWLKAKGRLSYADAFAAALARLKKCELLTGDSEFASIEADVKIRWL